MDRTGPGYSTPDPGTGDRRFRDPLVAAEYLEALRWPQGVVCPHCGERARSPYRLSSRRSTRRLWKCRACRRQFTVTVGTVFESSHLPLDRWLLAFRLVCSDAGPRSALALASTLGVTEKTARAVLRRVREAQAEAAAGRSGEDWDESEHAALRAALGHPRRRSSGGAPLGMERVGDDGEVTPDRAAEGCSLGALGFSNGVDFRASVG